MRRALTIVALLAAACSGNLDSLRAARVIQQQLYPNGPVAQSVTFDVGAQCLERDPDLRTSLVETLDRLGYLATSPAQIACDPSARAAQIQLTAKGIARTGRDDWSVSVHTHTVTLARHSFVSVTRVQQRSPNDAMVTFLIRAVRTPIGEETDVVGAAQEPMQAQFKRVGSAWRIDRVMQ